MPSNETDEVSIEQNYCFVCDKPTSGLFYNLSQALTETSETKMAKVLEQLVGEEYIVMIQDTDIICRGCWNILNTMDRLETNLINLGSTILEYLEKKYTLSPGEIFETAPPLKISFKKGRKIPLEENPLVRIGKEKEDGEELGKENSSGKMVCDKCTFSTEYNAMMVYHIRLHNKEEISQTQVITSVVPPPPIQEVVVEKKTTSKAVNKKIKEEPKTRKSKRIQRKKAIKTENTEEMMDVGDAIQNVLDANDQRNLHLIEESIGNDIELLSTEKDNDGFLLGIVDEATGKLINDDGGSSLEVEQVQEMQESMHELQEVEGNPGVFFMIDHSTGTGKLVKKLKQSEDGHYVLLDIDGTDIYNVGAEANDESSTIIPTLDDGTTPASTLVTLPFDDPTTSVLDDNEDIVQFDSLTNS